MLLIVGTGSFVGTGDFLEPETLFMLLDAALY